VAVPLVGCGKERQQAVCVDRFNQIVDPVACQALQSEAISHQNDQSWLQQYLLYRWAFGGRQNGMTYVTTQCVPVYQPLPSRYRPMSQSSYVQTYRSVNHRTPSTATPPTTARPSTTGSTATTAPKTTTRRSSSTSKTTARSSTSKASSPKTTTRTRTKS
jgi:hypothetical protein